MVGNVRNDLLVEWLSYPFINLQNMRQEDVIVPPVLGVKIQFKKKYLKPPPNLVDGCFQK